MQSLHLRHDGNDSLYDVYDVMRRNTPFSHSDTRFLARGLRNPRRAGAAPWKRLLGMSGPTRLPIEFDPGS